MNNASVLSRDNNWLVAWVGEEMVMMSGKSGRCISVSETGGRIWDLLAQPQTLRSLCDSLAAEYAVEETVLRSEVMQFVEELREQDAITVSA